MSREGKKYLAYARECARQAEAAVDTERRNQLMELSRVWMEAALTEEAFRRDVGLASGGAPVSDAIGVAER